MPAESKQGERSGGIKLQLPGLLIHDFQPGELLLQARLRPHPGVQALTFFRISWRWRWALGPADREGRASGEAGCGLGAQVGKILLLPTARRRKGQAKGAGHRLVLGKGRLGRWEGIVGEVMSSSVQTQLLEMPRTHHLVSWRCFFTSALGSPGGLLSTFNAA